MTLRHQRCQIRETSVEEIYRQGVEKAQGEKCVVVIKDRRVEPAKPSNIRHGATGFRVLPARFCYCVVQYFLLMPFSSLLK